MNTALTARQQTFLGAYRYSGMVKEAAAQVGCSRELHYGAMRTSEAYREAFALVQEVVAYELEEEARRRAIDGVKIPVFYQGKVIGYDTRYSDALLLFLLEGNHPEKFGGIQEELGSDGDGFFVRWDREGTGRPRLPTISVPRPPKPPQPEGLPGRRVLRLESAANPSHTPNGPRRGAMRTFQTAAPSTRRDWLVGSRATTSDRWSGCRRKRPQTS